MPELWRSKELELQAKQLQKQLSSSFSENLQIGISLEEMKPINLTGMDCIPEEII